MSKEHKPLESTKSFYFNTIWVVPILALIVASWMLYENWAQQGPEITITATDADGIQAGKTKVKARNVDIGEVENIQLSDDFNHAIITVRMQHGTEELLRQSTQFWVVKPRVGKEGISGLGTILSGAFINMEPGSEGDETHKFQMLTQPPLSTTDDKGIRINLFSTDNSKMEIGSPVHFRGYEVGYIEDVGFDIKRSAITYRIFIHTPYDSLVTDNVQFWITPGLEISGTAKGLEVRFDSLQNFISGGISFGNVMTKPNSHKVEDLTEFTLYKSKESAINNHYDKHVNYILLLSGNVGGLSSGSPVEYNGIRLGTIKQVPFGGVSLNSTDRFIEAPVIPVLMSIEPQRIEMNLTKSDLSVNQWKTLLHNGFKKGLRASLSTSNLLTGSKIISLHFVKHAQPVKPQIYSGYPVFPTTNDSLASMQQKVETILDNLASLPLNKTTNELNRTLVRSQKTLAQIETASQNLSKLLAQEKSQQLPDELTKMLQNLNATMHDFQAQGVIGGNLEQSMKSFQQSMDELQPLLKELRQQPNSLIFGKELPEDIIPKAEKKHR